MTWIKWLINLAKTAKAEPTTFIITLLLLIIGAETKVIINREKKLDKCQNANAIIQGFYAAKLDSINTHYNSNIRNLSNKIEENLSATLNDYRERLRALEGVNRIVDSTIKKNKKVLSTNKAIIQNIE